MEKINPLDLELGFNWDADKSKIRSEDGIVINFNRLKDYGHDDNPFEMRKEYSYYNTGIVLGDRELTNRIITWKININLNYMDAYPPDSNRINAFINVLVHEFLHVLGLAHLLHIKLGKKMELSIMNPKVSTADLYWTKSAEMALRLLYGGFGKRFEFKDSDIGKTAYFLHWFSIKKSFALPIGRKIMYVPGVKRGYKLIVQ